MSMPSGKSLPATGIGVSTTTPIRAKDRIYSKWGGFLEDVLFDPLVFGMPPNSLLSIEPLQLMLLEAVRQALAHAGYAERPFDREQTCAILGIGGGGGPLSVNYGFRSCLQMLDSVPGMPEKSDTLLKRLDPYLPEWTEDSFPGFLANVAAGRVANRFNLGGTNFAIDAACASSLAALHLAIRELESGTSNVALAMGADTVQTPYAFMAFSKTHALSPRGRCRPFDESADGIVLSEGIGVVMLKRLEDAERDGDKVWAVVKGMGASSDGKDKGLTAPRAEGQLRALRRAYAAAGVSPAQIGLIEAHGTGTVVGDRTEAQALRQMFVESGAAEASCAVGSVKSLIGHSKCAAGIAGLIKTVLALHNKVLPPTQVEKPNPRAGLDSGPLYLNTEARPWVQGDGQPRRAGVSAFGFGGTNFHAVLEEYTGHSQTRQPDPLPTWPAELLVWRASNRKALFEDLTQVQQALSKGARPDLADWALSLSKALPAETNLPTLALVATSLEDAGEKIGSALKALQQSDRTWHDPRGVWFAENPAEATGKVAVLFPGQGSQYLNMLAQTVLAFPQAREVLDRADFALRGQLESPLSRFLYPPFFTPEQEQERKQQLTRTEVAQPAVGTASLALWSVLHGTLGLQADFLAGHSYGEYVALHVAGAMTEEHLLHLSHRRGAVIHEATGQMPGAMAALEAGSEVVAEHLQASQADTYALQQVSLANLNSPSQTVISGSEEGVAAALALFKEKGIRGQRLPVACGFHSPLVAPAQDRLNEALREIPLMSPKIPVYSNVTARPYPEDQAEMLALLSTHLTSPVRFQEQIEALYQAGARIFIEVGPQGVLTGLTGQVLKDRPHLAVASDRRAGSGAGRSGLVQLHHLLAQLLVHGVPLQLARLHEHRERKGFDLAQLEQQTDKPKVTASTWAVNSVRSKPFHAPEPRLLGQPQHIEEAPPRNAAMQKPAPVPPAIAEQAAPRPATAPRPGVPAVGAGAPPPAFVPVSPAPGQRLPVAGPTATPALPPRPVSQTSSTPAESAQVMLRFQDLMARFLETQKSVMLAYLQGGQAQPTAAVPLPAAALPPVSQVQANGQPQNSLNGYSHSHTPDLLRGRPADPTPAPRNTLPAASAVASSMPKTTSPDAASPPLQVAEALPKTGKLALDRDALLARLLDLVSQRTGYPKEMLDLDLDLEADLGIDSIKRVEILSGLAESVEGIDMTASNTEMEKLTTIRTLRGIVEFLDRSISQHGDASAGAKPASSTFTRLTDETVREVDITRLGVQLIDAPLPEQALLPNFTGALLLTDDEQGVAGALSERLGELGVKSILLRMTSSVRNGSTEPGYSADLTEPQAVAAVLDRIQAEVGSLSGLIHLLPLAEPPAGELPEQRARREVKSLYLLSRALESGLRQQGKEGNAVLLAATRLGGRLGLGSEPLPVDFFCGQGGVLGFTKCIAHEWPEVLVRAVDLEMGRPAAGLAESLLAEMGDREGPLEVGLVGSRRVTTLTMPAPLDRDRPPLELDSRMNILVTGGARGITAEVALELARRYRPTLVLVGRSPMPGEESDETAPLGSPADIKAALMAQLQRQGQSFTPASIETAYQRLMTDREIRTNLARLRETGAPVHYRSVDVRKESEMSALLKEMEGLGGVDGVIHGAGVIEDRLLRDKTPESFERVFGTKVDSALILSRLLKPEQLKFLVLFSSLAGRYGNRGQSDYAAANEVLAKLADDCNRRWPARVVSIAWGPWSGTGMVADLAKHLVARGLKLIAPEVGSKLVLDEILYGARADSEVVVAGGSEEFARPVRPTVQAVEA